MTSLAPFLSLIRDVLTLQVSRSAVVTRPRAWLDNMNLPSSFLRRIIHSPKMLLGRSNTRCRVLGSTAQLSQAGGKPATLVRRS
ncbi:MAG: hypothetical protein ACJ8BC_06665 [Gemmatimonadales bacterium]